MKSLKLVLLVLSLVTIVVPSFGIISKKAFYPKKILTDINGNTLQILPQKAPNIVEIGLFNSQNQMRFKRINTFGENENIVDAYLLTMDNFVYLFGKKLVPNQKELFIAKLEIKSGFTKVGDLTFQGLSTNIQIEEIIPHKKDNIFDIVIYENPVFSELPGIAVKLTISADRLQLIGQEILD